MSKMDEIIQRIKKYWIQKEKDDVNDKISFDRLWFRAEQVVHDIEEISNKPEDLPIIEIGQDLFDDDYLTYVAVVPTKLCGTTCDEMEKFTESKWKGKEWNGFKGIDNSDYVLIFYRNPKDVADIPIANEEEEEEF